MKKFMKSRFLIAVVLIFMMLSTVNCGFLLYPERRGNRPGVIDGTVLVMDCLWLLAGVVPGVVALVVDFTSGSIYFGGHGNTHRWNRRRIDIRMNDSMNAPAFRVHPGDRIGFNLAGPAPAAAEVDVILSPESGVHKAVTLLDRKYVKGEASEKMVMLTIPGKLSPGAYRIQVKVNGLASSSLNLSVTL
ncbi:MAG: hypothetical protein M1381_04235 [Deltaproteobacteria bacterium]|nr:hypothetical protein [Deltaproteobacteria bacterium]